MDLSVLQREWDEAGSEWGRIWPQLIARTWSDEEFKNKLLTSRDPKAILAAEYKELPLLQNLNLKVIEEGAAQGPANLSDTMSVLLVLPKKPLDLQMEVLRHVITSQGIQNAQPPPPPKGGPPKTSCC